MAAISRQLSMFRTSLIAWAQLKLSVTSNGLLSASGHGIGRRMGSTVLLSLSALFEGCRNGIGAPWCWRWGCWNGIDRQCTGHPGRGAGTVSVPPGAGALGVLERYWWAMYGQPGRGAGTVSVTPAAGALGVLERYWWAMYGQPGRGAGTVSVPPGAGAGGVGTVLTGNVRATWQGC